MFEDVMKVLKDTGIGNGVAETEYVIWPLPERGRGQMLFFMWKR